MKKVLVFLLTLGFAVSAFAVDLGNGFTLVGEVKTGLAVETADDGNGDTDDTTAKGWNQDAERALRVRLTAGYAADWGGAKIRFQSDEKEPGPGEQGTLFFTKFAYGWANILGGKIVVSGGQAIEDIWGLGKLSANVFDPSLDGVNGVRIAFNLVDGLSFGVALPFSAGAQPIGDVFGSTVFGALYKSDFISGAVSLALHPGTDAVTGTSAVPEYDPWVDVILGVEVNPVSVLKILVDARIDTRKAYDSDVNRTPINDKNGYTRIGPLVQYSSGPLTAHVRGDITIQNDGYGKDSSGKDYKGQKLAELGVTEDLLKELHASPWAPIESLGDTILAFRVGGAYQVLEPLNAYLQIGSDNVGYVKGAGLYVKPGVKITVGGGSIEIFDKINRLGAEEIKGADPIKDHSPITNQFQIDFNWSF
jgi:hypothetical protein